MFRKLSVLCLGILFGLTSFTIAYGTIPKPMNVVIEGPGALYVGANGKNEVYFWILNDSKSTLVQTVTVTSKSPLLVNVDIKKGISGVFYADNLPLGNDLRMTFNGNTSGTKDCPKCGVMMPLNADSFIPFLKGGSLAETEKNQQLIYSTANDINKNLAEIGGKFVEMQKDNLGEFYLVNKALFEEGDKKLSGYRDEIIPFQAKIEGKANADAEKTKQIVEKYSNFLLSFTNIRTKVISCGKYERNWGLRTQLINSLNLTKETDDDENTPNGTDNPRNAIIDSYENLFDGVNKDTEKCMDGLFANFLTAGDDVNFPGSTPNLSQGNFVSTADYEVIGNQMEEIAKRAEQDFDTWQTKIETDTAKFDKLDSYLKLRQASDKSVEPLLKFVSEKVLKDESANTNMSVASLNGLSGIMPLGGLSTMAQPSCNSNILFTINLNTPIIIGSFWNDEITGGSDRNLILSFGGDDCIYGKGEMDFVFAGKGNDLVDGGDDHDFLSGGKNNDTIYGNEGKTYTKLVPAPPGQPISITFDIGNFISGDAGDDTIYGMDNASPLNKNGFADVIIGDGLADETNSGVDSIDGDRGIDAIFGQSKNDILKNTGYGSVRVDGVPVILGSFFFGNKGNDTIFGTDTPLIAQEITLGDFIFGNEDDETIAAGQGQDFIFGNSGNDNINGGDGKDYIFGNAGNDIIHVDDGILNLALGNQGTDSIYGDTGIFNILIGNADNDLIQGGNKVDLALGNLGDDKVFGGDGPIDALFGGQGKDEMKGENGVDAIFGNAEKDNMRGGNSIDLIFGGDGVDWADGEAETDIIFGNKNNPNDTPRDNCFKAKPAVEFEKLYGSGGIDLIFGNSGCDELYGGVGIDALFGGGASDLLKGENDSDLMFGGEGEDKLFGGGFIDVGFGNEDADELYGEENSDLLFGNLGNDKLLGDDPSANTGGMDLLLGGSGDDKLYGYKDSDFIFGGENNDTIEGNEGADVLFGLNGDDSIFGGIDSDIIFGGDGIDNLNGDGGSDLIFGGGNDDTLNGGNDEDILFGRGGNDTIDDGGGNDLNFGGDGDDYIRAIDGSNIAFGNNNNDKMCSTGGDEPRDLLFGNKGADTLAGDNYPAVSLLKKDFLFLGQGGQGPPVWNNGCP